MKTCRHCGEPASNGIGNACYTCKNGLERYGLNRMDQEKLWEAQEYKCALCDKKVEKTRRQGNSGYIDHDHQTGRIRGILCHPCNTQLGYFERQSKNFLEKITKYLG